MTALPRRTIVTPVRLEGLGLHTGVPVRLTIHPGGDGIAFHHDGVRVPATPKHVTDTVRRTRIGGISTIEHLMAAFAGLEITDAEVEVTAAEMPGFDGSAAHLVDALTRAGVEHIGDAAPPVLDRPISLEHDGRRIDIRPGTGKWTFTYDMGERWPGSQTYTCVLPDELGEVATSRSFALVEEVPTLKENAIGQGIDWSAGLVIGHGEYVNGGRHPDEPARHKILDLMGDLYLSGVPVRLLDVTAYKAGHTAVTRAATLLAQAVRYEA